MTLPITRAYDILPYKFSVVLSREHIPEHSENWTKSSALSDEYGINYHGKTYKPLATYVKRNSNPKYAVRVLIGLAATIPTLGMAPKKFDEVRNLFQKNQKKVYLALYDSGRGVHEITGMIHSNTTVEEFTTAYNTYCTHDYSPGVVNGLFERTLSVGNIPLLRSLVENLGDNFLSKRSTLSDMIVATVQLLHEDKLSCTKAQNIVQELINLGANLNKISKKPELNFSRYECKSHSPKTVLDSIFCSCKKIPQKDWDKMQNVVGLITTQGGMAYQGKNCCKLKFISTNVLIIEKSF